MKFFYYLQYLLFPCAILAVYYIVQGSVFTYDLDDVGFGILCLGLSLSFDSMGDITVISKKEVKIFQNNKKFKMQVYFLLAVGILIALTTIFFIIQKWIANNDMNEQFYKLGLNCSSLVVAVFFSLKQFLDKKKYYDLNNCNK